MSDELSRAFEEVTKLGGPPLAGTWRLEHDGPYSVMVCRDAKGNITAMMHPDDFETIRKELNP